MPISATTTQALCRSWLDNYYTFTDMDSNSVQIETPFLDNSAEFITLYAAALPSGKIMLSDYGWTLNNLKTAGVSLSTNSQAVTEIIANCGLDYNEDVQAISAITPSEDFAATMHRMLQAILNIYGLEFIFNGGMQH